MKKKIFSALLAGVAFVAMSSAASAAECNLGDKNIRVAASEFITVTSPSAVTASKVYADGGMSAVSGVCTPEQFRLKFVELNGSDNITPQTILKIPVLLAAAPPAPAPVASASPVMVAKPLVQPVPVATASAVAPVPAPSPKLAAVRVQRTAAEKELQVVRAANAAFPASLQGRALGRIAALEQTVSNWKALEGRLTTAEGAITALQTSDTAQNTAIAKAGTDASTALDTANKAKAAADAAGGLAWYWKLLMGISVLLSAIALAVAFFRKSAKTDLTDYATIVDLAVVVASVEAVKSRFERSVERLPETPRPADLKSLSVNSVFRYPVLVDGVEAVFSGTVVQHSSSGEAIVKVDELSKPVAASKLFKELADYIEHGGAVSTVRAVNT